jgi:hypothetical protein
MLSRGSRRGSSSNSSTKASSSWECLKLIHPEAPSSSSHISAWMFNAQSASTGCKTTRRCLKDRGGTQGAGPSRCRKSLTRKQMDRTGCQVNHLSSIRRHRHSRVRASLCKQRKEATLMLIMVVDIRISITALRVRSLTSKSGSSRKSTRLPRLPSLVRRVRNLSLLANRLRLSSIGCLGSSNQDLLMVQIIMPLKSKMAPQ